MPILIVFLIVCEDDEDSDDDPFMDLDGALVMELEVLENLGIKNNSS